MEYSKKALLGSIVPLKNAIYTVHTYIHTVHTYIQTYICTTYIGLVGIDEFVGAK